MLNHSSHGSSLSRIGTIHGAKEDDGQHQWFVACAHTEGGSVYDSTIAVPDVEVVRHETRHTRRAAQILELLLNLSPLSIP